MHVWKLQVDLVLFTETMKSSEQENEQKVERLRENLPGGLFLCTIGCIVVQKGLQTLQSPLHRVTCSLITFNVAQEVQISVEPTYTHHHGAHWSNKYVLWCYGKYTNPVPVPFSSPAGVLVTSVSITVSF